MPKPKMSIQDLSLKTVIHSKARHSFCTYTDLHPTQSKPSGCPPEYKIHFCYLKLCVQDQCSSSSPTSACRFKYIYIYQCFQFPFNTDYLFYFVSSVEFPCSGSYQRHDEITKEPQITDEQL